MITALWILVVILFIIVTALIAWCISLEREADRIMSAVYKVSLEDRAQHIKDYHGGER